MNKISIGRRFDRWEVIGAALPRNGYAYWLCRCDCGTEREVMEQSLLRGLSRSCGCYRGDERAGNLGLYNGAAIARLKSDKAPKNSTSGVRGVYFDDANGKWRAAIIVQGQYRSRVCKTREEAIEARKELFREYAQPIIDEYERMKNEKSPEREKI